MSLIENLPLIVVVLGLIPLVWSGAVYALHAGAARLRQPHVASMRLEAAALLMMIAPVVVGGVLLASPPLPVDSPIPVIDLPEMSWEPAGVVEVRVDAVPAAPSAEPSWPIVSLAILGIYLAGLAICALKLARARLRLDRIARKSVPAREIADCVRLTDEAFSPFASACGAIILPRTLAETLPPGELALIVEHERAHLGRGDPRAFWALACVDTLFWFNPFVRRQTDRCRLAAELACDAAVVAAGPSVRETYAGALVAAVRHASADARRLPATAPGILSGRRSGEHRLRLTHIMSAEPQRRSPLARMAVSTAALLVVPVGALQLAACATGAAPVDASGVAAAPSDFVIFATPSDFAITAANEDELVVERAENRITLTGALALDSGDGTVTFDQVDVFFLPDADGRSRVERIFSPHAVLTHVPSPTGAPTQMLQATFTPCGGTLSLPAGLGQFPMGPENCASGVAVDAGTVRVSDVALEITAEGGAPTVERVDDTLVRLTGALRIRTADGEYLTDRADIQFTPAEQGEAQPTVLRVAVLDAQVIRSSDRPNLLTDDPIPLPGRPVQTGTTVFTLCAGQMVALPGLGRLEAGGDPCGQAASGAATNLADNPQEQPWDIVLTEVPVEGLVTNPFGPRIDPITDEPSYHSGVDLRAPEGTPIVAVAGGRVTFAGWRGGYGRVVEIDHGGDVKTRYAQLSAFDVATDDSVAAGQVIGRSGASGRATGPHLHFELWYASEVYDPMPVFRALGFDPLTGERTRAASRS